jgi:hypothetical protein
MDRTADIEGTQIKVLSGGVRPVRLSHGEAGIPVDGGVTLPFLVERRWNAPAGRYPEQWFLVDPSTREILYEGPEKQLLIWGLAAWTDATTEVPGGFPLAPGTYQIVFALGGAMGGQVDVATTDVVTGGA